MMMKSFQSSSPFLRLVHKDLMVLRCLSSGVQTARSWVSMGGVHLLLSPRLIMEIRTILAIKEPFTCGIAKANKWPNIVLRSSSTAFVYSWSATSLAIMRMSPSTSKTLLVFLRTCSLTALCLTESIPPESLNSCPLSSS